MQHVFERNRPEDYLTRLATTSVGRTYKALAVEELAAEPGDVVVDLGCGPGTDLRVLAEAVGSSGRVIGIDNNPDHVGQARASTTDLGDRVRVIEGDIHSLELAQSTVDCVHTDRVLQHVTEPEKVISEIRRVLRPGGRIVLAEPDWDTLIIDYSDLSVARAYSRFVADNVIRNPCLGRQLAGMVERHGLHVSKVLPITTVFRNATEADQILGLYRVTERATAGGYITPDAARAWLDSLANATFFASVTLFLTVAIRPEAD